MNTITPAVTVKPVTHAISEGVQQLSYDIDHSANDVEILLGAIFDKLDGLSDLLGVIGPFSGTVCEAIGAINCFASCVARGVTDIKNQNAKVLAATIADAS